VRINDPDYDNSIGVVWGYRSSSSFYVAQFKQVETNDNPTYWRTDLDGAPRTLGGDLSMNPIHRARAGLSVKK
jgi:hypothetical protein